MATDIDLIIKALEKEKKSLKRQIKISLSEFDYLIAYYHSEALLQLNHHLNMLYTFKDPLHNEKEHLKYKENNIKKKPEYVKDKDSWKRIMEGWKDLIENDKLRLLEKEKNVNKFFVDSQEIDNALFSLCEGRCNGFKLEFENYDEYQLNFVKKSNNLIISINPYSELFEPDFVIDNRISNPLRGLGFRYNEIDNTEVFEYDMTNFKNASQIKLLLSRLIFDVYHMYSANQHTKLIYY